jgi:hypothetical protein
MTTGDDESRKFQKNLETKGILGIVLQRIEFRAGGLLFESVRGLLDSFPSFCC